MSIWLICEWLSKIGNYTNFLKKDWDNLINHLLLLAKKIIVGVQDENFSRIFRDSDFKDRTLMRIISEKGYDKLFEDERIDLLLHEFWKGEGTTEWNGDLIDFSVLQYLASSPIRSLKWQKPKNKIDYSDWNILQWLKERNIGFNITSGIAQFHLYLSENFDDDLAMYYFSFI